MDARGTRPLLLNWMEVLARVGEHSIHKTFTWQNKTDKLSELSEVVNGTRKDFTVLNVNACGTENGGAAAWIRINKNGLVKFFNQGGNHSECMLNNEFNVGSWCAAADF